MAVTSSTPGFTKFRGRTSCDCLAEWLVVFEALALRLGIIKRPLQITQLTGGAAASGGTHEEGGAWDIWDILPALVWLAREMGSASWIRTKEQKFTPHTHGVLNGCPHNGPARYQVVAYLAGYNGLGKGGRGTRETSARKLRTWREGITWAKSQLENTTDTAPTEEDDMTPEEREMLKNTHDRVLTIMRPVEETRTLVGGVAKAFPTVQRWVSYLMPAAERQEKGLDALRDQVAAAQIETSDPALKAELEDIAGRLDAAIRRAS